MAGKKTKRQILAVVSNPDPSARAARNRRRRQRRSANRKSIARSAGSSVRKMQKWPSTKDGANFLRAALDPFSDISLRSVGVPDSFAGDTLKHTNTMEVTVFPDSDGNISFTYIPSASTPVVMRKGTFKAITIPISDAVTGDPAGTQVIDFDATAHSTANGEVIPGLAWPTWAVNYGSQTVHTSATTFGPFDYKSQRIVSQGLEWRYTGTELSDQGVCTAAILDSYIVEGYLDFPSNPPGWTTANTVAFQKRGDLNNLVANTQTNLSNQPKFVQQTMHSSEGAGGMSVLVAAEEGYILKTTDPRTSILNATITQTQYSSGILADSILATYGRKSGGAVTSLFPILPWQNLRPIGFAFTGLKTSGESSIVLRLKQRVEATVGVNSTYQQFTDKSPSEDGNALCIVSDIQKTLPVMVPVTMNGFGDWWRKIMGVISSAGKIVGGIGLPMVSPIAMGVGGIADILGSFADV